MTSPFSSAAAVSRRSARSPYSAARHHAPVSPGALSLSGLSSLALHPCTLRIWITSRRPGTVSSPLSVVPALGGTSAPFAIGQCWPSPSSARLSVFRVGSSDKWWKEIGVPAAWPLKHTIASVGEPDDRGERPPQRSGTRAQRVVRPRMTSWRPVRLGAAPVRTSVITAGCPRPSASPTTPATNPFRRSPLPSALPLRQLAVRFQCSASLAACRCRLRSCPPPVLEHRQRLRSPSVHTPPSPSPASGSSGLTSTRARFSASRPPTPLYQHWHSAPDSQRGAGGRRDRVYSPPHATSTLWCPRTPRRASHD